MPLAYFAGMTGLEESGACCCATGTSGKFGNCQNLYVQTIQLHKQVNLATLAQMTLPSPTRNFTLGDTFRSDVR